MATYSSVLAWRIPGTGEPGGLRSTGLHRVGHDWSDLAASADFLSEILKTQSQQDHIFKLLSCPLSTQSFWRFNRLKPFRGLLPNTTPCRDDACYSTTTAEWSGDFSVSNNSLRVVVESLSHVRPHGLHQAFTISRSLPKFMSIELVMLSNHLILCCPLLFHSSIFPSIMVFSIESALHIKWPKYWSFSFSISLFSNIQSWFPLGWTGLILLQTKGLSRVSLAPQFKSINSLALSLLYGPILTSIHDYWINHSFDSTDLHQQSNALAF